MGKAWIELPEPSRTARRRNGGARHASKEPRCVSSDASSNVASSNVASSNIASSVMSVVIGDATKRFKRAAVHSRLLS